MEAKTKQFRPEGWHTLTPRIVVDNAKGLVEFLREVFGAEGDYTTERPTVMKIGDSMLMVNDSGVRNRMPAFIYVYVDDPEKTYNLALLAGAHSMEEPGMTTYGDLRCMVKDEWGNTWQIARYSAKPAEE